MSSSRAGDLRVAGARLSFTSGPAFGGAITVRGVRPDRRLVALSIETTEVRNPADLELALMGLACGALATEAQGAVLIGSDLGMPGGAGVEGTIAEQVRAAIDRHASHLALIIATADTAQSLGDLPSYHRAPLANLVEYRRTDA